MTHPEGAPVPSMFLTPEGTFISDQGTTGEGPSFGDIFQTVSTSAFQSLASIFGDSGEPGGGPTAAPVSARGAIGAGTILLIGGVILAVVLLR